VHELLSARSTTKRGESMPQRQERIAQADVRLTAAAHALSRTLLAPVAAQLGNKRLVVVADGALQSVPFAMLPEPQFPVQSSEFRVKDARSQNPKLETPNPKPLVVNHEIV